MTIALSAAVVVLGGLVLLLLGSQVEMYRSLAQLREYAGLVDNPLALEIGDNAGAAPASRGLPDALDRAENAVVLFLSDKCGTCRSIASTLDGRMPPDLWVVLDPADPTATADIALTYRLAEERLVIDSTRELSATLAMRTTPAALVIRDGRISHGTTVPSSRSLEALLDAVRAGRARKPAESVPLSAASSSMLSPVSNGRGQE
ncbi:hypothetical protein [Planosporangium mesophilum]|uniref:Thioredoxin domain-containing protein n=1 Tax=Planosporangium mesophilum TaxID=689768 RepID=A0A8J3WYU5_9ACTN|nr:hypothetical protein [Planosporangium mesophilum]GII21650.1 hypothetical protein Pme01_12470 [Planosporangium mesophilum]